MNGINGLREKAHVGGLDKILSNRRIVQSRPSCIITALHLSFTTIRGILFCVALSFWILYFHEIWFRSGRVRMHWLKRGIADILLMLSIAIVTFLVITLISGLPSHHRPH